MRYENVEIHNAVETVTPEKGEGFYISRIPETVRKALNPSAQNCALYTAGVEIRCNLTNGGLRVILESEGTRASIAEVYHGPFFGSFFHIANSGKTEIKVEMPADIEALCEIAKKENSPFDPRLVRVMLPYKEKIRVHAIYADGTSTLPGPDQVPRTRYLAYGSSITHGFTGLMATGGYAMQTARRLGADLINLGFAGGAHCENEIAEYIADRNDWDFATLELGINMLGSFEPDEFARRVRFMVGRIARAHKDKWVFCTDLFRFDGDYFSPNHPGMAKQNEFRQTVASAVEEMGLPRLVYLDGRDLLPSYLGLTSDLLHPSPFGMSMISERLSGMMQEKMSGG